MHHVQHRDLVMRRGPQHSGRVVQIAVALNIDGQASMLFVGESRAYRGGRLIADTCAALRSDVMVGLAEVPQARGPGTDEAVVRYQRPIFILDLRPDLGGEACGGDRAGVPGDGGQFAIARAGRLIFGGDRG